MGRAARPTTHEVVRVMRAASDIRDLAGDVQAQRGALVRSCRELFDGPRAFSVVIRDLRPAGACTPESMVAGGSDTTCEADFLSQLRVWSDPSLFTPLDDPLMEDAAQAADLVRVASVSADMEPQRWDASPMYQICGEGARPRDIMVGHFPAGPSETGDRVIGMAVHRLRGQRSFTRRDLAIWGVLNDELARLYRLGALPWWPDLPVAFSRRQREIAARMLRGLGAKAIAADLGVATDTVYSYAKAMYRRARVMDRHELVAWLRANPEALADRGDGYLVGVSGGPDGGEETGAGAVGSGHA